MRVSTGIAGQLHEVADQVRDAEAMGYDMLAAEEVAHENDIAVGLGTDPAFHGQQVEAIRANKEKLYDDPAPIEAFAQFLLECG